jgi:hypothetical protein
MPINKYKHVQTGPNNQFGGVKDGLFNVTYQSFTPSMVKYPEILPTRSGKRMQMNNRETRFIINQFIFDEIV